MVYLKNIEEIRKIQWGQKHLFDVRFPSGFKNNADVPKNFKNFFPVIDVQENLATVQSETISTHLSTFSFPKSSTEFDLQITFYDDAEYSLTNFFDNWVNNIILGGGKYIAPLEKCVKLIEVAKLDVHRNIIQKKAYLVYPDGAFNYQGDSSGDAITYSVTFKICGTL